MWQAPDDALGVAKQCPRTQQRQDSTQEMQGVNAMKVLEIAEKLTECDRCPARALHLYVEPNTNRVLTFCGHHSTEYGHALEYLGWRSHVLEGANR
jgi:hypothetical protein